MRSMQKMIKQKMVIIAWELSMHSICRNIYIERKKCLIFLKCNFLRIQAKFLSSLVTVFTHLLSIADFKLWRFMLSI